MNSEPSYNSAKIDGAISHLCVLCVFRQMCAVEELKIAI